MRLSCLLDMGSAPRNYDWDDYKNADLTGKVALLLLNEPRSDDQSFFKGKALTYYGGGAYKFEETARRGAIATLIIHRADLAGYSCDVLGNSWGTERSYLQRDTLRSAAWIQSEAARNLLSWQGWIWTSCSRERNRKTSSRWIAHAIAGARSQPSAPAVVRNVLAVLPSRGPAATEAVLYTAHYDHLGVDPDRNGHNIFNGAVDKASGCAVLMELARTRSQTTKAPYT